MINIIPTTHYKQSRRASIMRAAHCLAFVASVAGVYALAVAALHDAACKPAVHVQRVLEVYPLGEHVHVWRRTYNNCKGE